MQQRAGRDRLNGFAEPHFVRQQRPLRKSEVQHPFPLIREERHRRFLRGPFAALHFEFVLMPEAPALRHQSAILQPRFDLLRNPEPGQASLTQPPQLLHRSFRFGLDQQAIRAKPFAHGRRKLGPVMAHPQRASSRVQRNLDAAGSLFFSRFEKLFLARMQMQPHRLDMLAKPESVNAKIDAGATILARAQVTNLHGVTLAAGRIDAKIGEDRVRGRGVDDATRFFPGALAAFVDLVRVRGAPIVRGWDRGFRLDSPGCSHAERIG